MNQVVSLTSTYSSDEFGICSALFELGGLVVMHDASGCNSTYTTHDEPRWYDTDSMIYVSAISELEAIMGDDEKLLLDLEETANALHPRFIALIGAPIPYMIGTDLPALARIIEERTGLPAFGFPANGMNLYTKGVSDALYALVERFCVPCQKQEPPSLNILGATPLDLPAKGCIPAIWEWARRYGFEKGASLSLETSLEEISRAGEATVNLVVSYGGLAAARLLKERFGTPYVVGLPLGEIFAENLGQKLQAAAGYADWDLHTSFVPPCHSERSEESPQAAVSATNHCLPHQEPPTAQTAVEPPLLIVGESVFATSFAASIELEQGVPTKVLCPVDTDDELLRPGDLRVYEEDDLLRHFSNASKIAADPLFRPLAPANASFYDLPHTAFSGRIFEKTVPNRIAVKIREDFR